MRWCPVGSARSSEVEASTCSRCCIGQGADSSGTCGCVTHLDRRGKLSCPVFVGSGQTDDGIECSVSSARRLCSGSRTSVFSTASSKIPTTRRSPSHADGAAAPGGSTHFSQSARSLPSYAALCVLERHAERRTRTFRPIHCIAKKVAAPGVRQYCQRSVDSKVHACARTVLDGDVQASRGGRRGSGGTHGEGTASGAHSPAGHVASHVTGGAHLCAEYMQSHAAVTIEPAHLVCEGAVNTVERFWAATEDAGLQHRQRATCWPGTQLALMHARIHSQTGGTHTSGRAASQGCASGCAEGSAVREPGSPSETETWVASMDKTERSECNGDAARSVLAVRASLKLLCLHFQLTKSDPPRRVGAAR